MWRPDVETREIISASRGPVLRMLARVALLSFALGLFTTWLMGDATAGFALAGVFLVTASFACLIEAALMIRSMSRMDDDDDIVEEEEKA